MILPKQIFKLIDKKLHNANVLIYQAEEEYQKAQGSCFNLSCGIVKGYGARNNFESTTSKNALLLADCQQVIDESKIWVKVIEEAKVYFKNKDEQILFNKYYGCNITILNFCNEYYISKQTFIRYRNNIIVLVAIIASQRQLINISKFIR